MPVIALLAAIALAGCASATPPPAKAPAHAKHDRLKPLRCPRDAHNCRAATGRVIYVEAKDPDGDGDAHLVLASEEAISGPGITVVDIERELRPHPLPRVGDRVAAAGPVYRGSYGQRQIEADRIRVPR